MLAFACYALAIRPATTYNNLYCLYFLIYCLISEVISAPFIVPQSSVANMAKLGTRLSVSPEYLL